MMILCMIFILYRGENGIDLCIDELSKIGLTVDEIIKAL